MNPPNIKKRKLNFDSDNSTQTLLHLKQDFDQTEGILKTSINLKQKYIYIEYDFNQIKFETIEKNILSSGLPLSTKKWHKFKRGLIKYTEQNESDQLIVPPRPCCNLPESATRNNKR